jgi:hypothetical protein
LTITTYHFRFGDCTERWSSFFELRRLGDPEEEEADEGTTGLPAPSPPKTRLELLQAGLEKTRFFIKKKKPAQWVFFWGGGWGFLGLFIYLLRRERSFRVFSVSRILLGASRLKL